MRIAAVVVTYNRKDLLLECISGVHGQEELSSDIQLDVIVVDNASADGTEAAVRQLITSRDTVGYISESAYENGKECFKGDSKKDIVGRRIIYFNTGSNLGGAGGFQYGIRKAVELGYDYLWLMDDDCIPSERALAAFIDAMHNLPVRIGPWGFLSSKTLWRDGSICKMNVQRATLTKNVKDFPDHLIKPVVMASFVSLLVPAAVVKELGLPIKEFFIWTDDWEWTRRISRKYPCYLVTNSVVTHKSKQNIKADIAHETEDRLDRFYYLYRNDVVLYRREGIKGFAYECVRLAGHIVRVIRNSDHKWKRIKKIIGGTAAGLKFYPQIEYVESISNK